MVQSVTLIYISHGFLRTKSLPHTSIQDPYCSVQTSNLARCIARRLSHKVLDKAVLSRLGIGLVLLIALGL